MSPPVSFSDQHFPRSVVGVGNIAHFISFRISEDILTKTGLLYSLKCYNWTILIKLVQTMFSQSIKERRKLENYMRKNYWKILFPRISLLKIVFFWFTGQISLTSVTPGQLWRRVHKRIFKPLLIKKIIVILQMKYLEMVKIHKNFKQRPHAQLLARGEKLKTFLP